jgi:predicted membrane protein
MENAPRNVRRTDSWKPILAIAVMALVATAVLDRPAVVEGAQEGSTSDKTFSDVAFMSKVKRQSNSSPFRGGEATTFMGEADIDLREAVMQGREVTLDVSSVMGEMKIRVPETWTVVSHVDTLLGEFKNSARRPTHETHRLILQGSVVMSEVKVMN